MKKYFLVLILGFLFSCSQREEPIHINGTDTANVYVNPPVDTIREIEADSLRSEITCPKCNFKKKEKMPTDVCLLKYTCTACRSELVPKEGVCCVFCTYGDHKCPSKQ